MKEIKNIRTDDELIEIFNQQIYFLKKSSEEYDDDVEIESIRLAGHLRTLLHDSFTRKDEKFDTKLINCVIELREVLISSGDYKKSEPSQFRKVNKYIQTLESSIKSSKKITSKSLMFLLKERDLIDDVKFLDTSIKDKKVFSFFEFGDNCNNLTIRSGKMEFKSLVYHKLFDLNSCPYINFDSWWNNKIYDDEKEISLSRKDIILNVANQEGFAHVGERLNYKYV